MRRIIRAVLMALLLAPFGTAHAPAQVERAIIGGTLGVAGGVLITMSAVVARAHLQNEYLFEVGELIHWQSIPMIATPGAGVVFGVLGRDPLVGSVLGSTTGMLTGAGLGALIGWIVSAQPEGPWAGGVIGAGAGMAIGGLAGGLLGWHKQTEDSPSEARLEMRIPLSWGNR